MEKKKTGFGKAIKWCVSGIKSPRSGGFKSSRSGGIKSSGKRWKPEIIPFGEDDMKLVSMIRAIPDDANFKDLFMWELLCNANSALGRVWIESLVDKDKYGDRPELKIHIIPDEDKGTLSIVDNGIGMTRDDLVRKLIKDSYIHMNNIKKCSTYDPGVDLSQILSTHRGDISLGFFSAFLVADKVVVTTKKVGHDPYVWEFDANANGGSTFSVAPAPAPAAAQDSDSFDRGTKVTLHLKNGKAYLEYLDVHKLKELTNKYPRVVHFYPVFLFNNENKLHARLNAEEEKEPFEEVKARYGDILELFAQHIREKGKNVDVVFSERAEPVFSNLNVLKSEDGVKSEWEINPRCIEMEEFTKLVKSNCITDVFKEEFKEKVKYWNTMGEPFKDDEYDYKNEIMKYVYRETVKSGGDMNDEEFKDEAMKLRFEKYMIDHYFELALFRIEAYDWFNGTSFYKDAIKSLS